MVSKVYSPRWSDEMPGKEQLALLVSGEERRGLGDVLERIGDFLEYGFVLVHGASQHSVPD